MHQPINKLRCSPLAGGQPQHMMLRRCLLSTSSSSWWLRHSSLLGSSTAASSTHSRRQLLIACSSGSGESASAKQDATSAPRSRRRTRRATTASTSSAVSPRQQQAQLPAGALGSLINNSSSSFSTSTAPAASSSGSKAARTPRKTANTANTSTSSTTRSRTTNSTTTSSSSSKTPSTSPSAVSTNQQVSLPQSEGLFAPAPQQLVGADSVSSWVVFSDLHVSHKTLDTAVAVLRRVHEEARSRGAGVLFLGDFWDRRGDLPVIPLNTIHSEMSSWGDTPLLMLSGNHDQVDLAGEHHALDPVAVAAANAHVFTQPTLYKDALWLPYRRDEGVIRTAIAAALQQGPLKAIFGHADVLTAHMNASYQARDGLPPDLFPQQIPVYLGHYHFPHTLPGTAITYVGSQYQVTASEAGQAKRLLLLDEHWRQLDSLPINLGRKYFSLTTPAAAAAAASGSNGSNGSNGGTVNEQGVVGVEPTAAAAAAAAGGNGSSSNGSNGSSSSVLPLDVGYVTQLLQQGVLSRGDVLSVRAGSDGDDASEGAVREVMRLLEEQGVQVQLQRAPSSRPSARIDAAEQLSMSQLLEVYASNTGMREEVLAAARGTLKELGSQSSAVPQHSHLELDEVTVEGFGPFADATTYPLAGRGVVAVTGLNKDDAAAVSNGAGKTSLLTSLLWAFKAKDGRGMLNAHYINDTARTARVTVSGRINAEPFQLMRTVGRGKVKHPLQLSINGQELTGQESALTEEALEARFDTSLLPKTLVFTQEDLLGLLQSNDTAFKQMLSSIVDTDSWIKARAKAAEGVKSLEAQSSAVQGEMRTLERFVQKLHADVELTQQKETSWEAEQRTKQAAAEQSEQQGLQSAQQAAADTHQLLALCSSALRDIQTLQQGLDAAVAAAHAKAEAAAQDAAAAAASGSGFSGSQQQFGQQQQQPEEEEDVSKVLLSLQFDAAAAQAEQQPLLAAEASAAQQLRAQEAAVQELRGQLAAAQKRRKKYLKLHEKGGATSSSSISGGNSRKDSSSSSSGVERRGGLQPVCEQCLQPINVELYDRNLQDMAADEQQLQQQLDAAAANATALAADLTTAQQQLQEVQQRQQQQQKEAVASREAVLARQAEQSRLRAKEAERQRRLQEQQQQERQRALSEIWQEERRLNEFSRHLQSLHDSLSREHSDSTATLQQLQTRIDSLSPTSSALSTSSPAASTLPPRPAVDDVLSSLLLTPTSSNASANSPYARFSEACSSTRLQLRGGIDRLRQSVDSVAQSRAKLEQLAAAENPNSATVQALERQLQQHQADLDTQRQQQDELAHKVVVGKRVVDAFGPKGVPSFLLEGVLGELQGAASRHLSHLAAGMTLELSATSSKGGKGSRAAASGGSASSGSKRSGVVVRSEESVAEEGVSSSSEDGEEGESVSSGSDGSKKVGRRKKTTAAGSEEEEEKISKIVWVQGAGGALMQRSISQLSGGEKKRVALALGLGFAEVVAARGRLTSNILVLDEVLEKLDEEGCARVAWLLKGLPYDSCFVVGQAGSFVTKEFGSVDTVVKSGGRSFVELGGAGGAGGDAVAAAGEQGVGVEAVAVGVV